MGELPIRRPSQWLGVLTAAAIQAYILLLATIRLMFPKTTRYPTTSLWDHTALLYLFNFIFSSVSFRTALIHASSKLAQALSISEFSLVTLLCIIALSSRRGNKPVWQEAHNGLEPSQEPVATVFSVLTFGWVDPIVWKGYWKPFELSDVWNLREDDFAVYVLNAFRQTKFVSPSRIYDILPNV